VFPARAQLRTQDFEPDYVSYREALLEAGLYDASRYIDIRGNHDDADYADYDSPTDYFKDYSVAGHFNVLRSDGVLVLNYSGVSIVALDIVNTPGLSVPLNSLMGSASPALVRRLDSVLTSLDWSGQPTLVLGHYPLNWLQTTSLTDVLDAHRVRAYLCGHWHSRDMSSHLRPNVLELEQMNTFAAGDYRILSFDSGVFSYTDVIPIDGAPAVHITMPPDARAMDGREPLLRVRACTTLRALVFWNASSDGNVTVTAGIDGTHYCTMSPVLEYAGLYGCAWSGAAYDGLHELTVTATTASGTCGMSAFDSRLWFRRCIAILTATAPLLSDCRFCVSSGTCI
jgi:Calcineurin-like phosphoesterase